MKSVKRDLSLLLLLLLNSLVLKAQQQPSGLVDFKVYVPDGEVVQGNRVQIAYVLDAKNYSIKSFDGGIEGGKLESYDSEKSINGNIHRVKVVATYSISGTGQLKVKPMKAVVDGMTVCSDSTVLNVKPNPKYGNQWKQATAFLKGKGVEAPSLSYKYGMETLCAFSDDENKCFAVVVSEDYSRYVEIPILAYGIGNSMWQADNDDNKDNTIYSILNRYNQQIRQLSKDNVAYTSLRPISYTPKPEGVKPLLGSIEYGQSNPYNNLFPKEKYMGRDSSCIAGCGPVALAQVLSYYHKPVNLEGECTVTTKTGRRYGIAMEDFPVRWSGSDSDLASLMIDCAGSVSAEIGLNGTSSSLSNFKSALVRFWKYSPQCTLVRNYYDFNVLAMIYSEIDDGRPVIVSDDSHIFVCDGYYQDYLHYNLGWGGYCNGFYRAMIVPSVDSNQLPFNELLMGISPLDKENAVDIEVKEPGTLSDLLGQKSPQTITTLVVTGILDGDDISFLRNLAGAIPISGSYEDGHGSLMNLDLSGAAIIGGKSYFLQRADGLILQGYYSDMSGSHSYKFNMSNISDDDWNTIVQHGFNMLENAELLKGDDGHYYSSFIAQDNVIGDHMFENCDNMTTITLPKNVKEIGNYAFHNCKSLHTVKNKPGKVSKNAFQNCRFIE